MKEAIGLFREVCHLDWLCHSNIVLLLNKTDLAPETETVRTELDRFNSDALLVECVHSRIDLDLLFGSEVSKVPKASEAVGEYESRCHRSNQPIPRIHCILIFHGYLQLQCEFMFLWL